MAHSRPSGRGQICLIGLCKQWDEKPGHERLGLGMRPRTKLHSTNQQRRRQEEELWKRTGILQLKNASGEVPLGTDPEKWTGQHRGKEGTSVAARSSATSHCGDPWAQDYLWVSGDIWSLLTFLGTSQQSTHFRSQTKASPKNRFLVESGGECFIRTKHTDILREVFS